MSQACDGLFRCSVHILNPRSHEMRAKDKVHPDRGSAGPREGAKEARKSSLAGSQEPSSCLKPFTGVKSVSRQAKHIELHLTSLLPRAHREATYKEGPGPSQPVGRLSLTILFFTL